MSEILLSTVKTTRIISLNRPEKRNALNGALIKCLREALREADADENLRAIVIRGEGKDFCSGADLETLREISESSYEENLADAERLTDLFGLIRRVRIPVIAAVHGRALAGGAGLASACDIVLATRSAIFGYPEVKIGFVPAIVTAFLRRNISEKLAFEMITRGEEFGAQRAFEIGLVNRLYDDESFGEDVHAYAMEYEKVSRTAVVMCKELLYRMDGLGFDQSLAAGAEVNAKARMTDDCRLGIARFLNK